MLTFLFAISLATLPRFETPVSSYFLVENRLRQSAQHQQSYVSKSLLLVSAWKIVKMKRALPSGEVAAASKLFEKFFAAEEFEDILYFHNELCNVLKICPGPLSSFYNVIKVMKCL